jgi:hypothetical protein
LPYTALCRQHTALLKLLEVLHQGDH